MPPTRRARSSAGGGLSTKSTAQSTLSFTSSKNTRASLTPKDKDVSLPIPLASSTTASVPTTKDLSSVGHVTSEAAVAEQARTEHASLKAEQSSEQRRASKVTDAQIRRYWASREGERRAGRVHQEGLGVEEKVLRLWDMSSQYGPAIGIPRTKRWVRAHKLGLAPPIEVLAVLLRQEENNRGSERAYVDELMSLKVGGGE